MYVIPEPSALGLILFGLLAWASRAGGEWSGGAVRPRWSAKHVRSRVRQNAEG